MMLTVGGPKVNTVSHNFSGEVYEQYWISGLIYFIISIFIIIFCTPKRRKPAKAKARRQPVMQERGFSPIERYGLGPQSSRRRQKKTSNIDVADDQLEPGSGLNDSQDEQQAGRERHTPDGNTSRDEQKSGRGKHTPGQNSSQDEQQSSRGSHPPGLKGKEIGMWYARRSKEKQEKQRSSNTSSLFMDRQSENNIRRLLSSLQTDNETSPGSAVNTSSFQGNSNSSANASFVEEGHNCSSKTSEKFSLGEITTDVLEVEPPDSWDMCKNDSDETPEADANLSSSQEELSCLEEDNEDVLQLPSVVGVVEYMKSHSDYPYIGQEPESDFVADIASSPRDTEMDAKLKSTFEELVKKKQYISMLDFRKKLPSYEMKDVIVNSIRDNQVLVISGETGCGKTTQVPQFILDDHITRGEGSQCRIVCTQPRRISAISVAERVAAERCEKIGGAVGYQIRLESRFPRPQGSILFCTTGIVLKFLENDPSLNRATHIIIDEIHERDLLSDFLMIILKDLIPKRSDLRVILMSATLNADMFSTYFNSCSILEIPGHTFPVQEYLLEDIIELTNYEPDKKKKPPSRPRRNKMSSKEKEELDNYELWRRSLYPRYKHKTIDVLQMFDYSVIDLDLVVHIVTHIVLHMKDGAILIFVPGWEEIKKLHEMIQKTLRARSSSFRVIPLHSLMPTVNQREVFDKPPPGVRKIVIATNIAETSITIDDVVFVIDSGKIKVKNFQPEMNLSSLETQWVSKANARQRRGRAGRVQPGHCFHLYTEFHYNSSQDYLPPELLRTRLEELCLQIKLLKLGKIVPFISKAMQHPPVESINHAVQTLIELSALDANENLLPLGYHLARLPMEPHTGKMILFGAMFCCLDPVLTVAASLSFRDAFTIPLGKENLADQVRKNLAGESRSDHIMLINAYRGWEESKRYGNNRTYCWEHFLSENTLKMLLEMKKQLSQILYDIGFLASPDVKFPNSNINSNNQSLLKAVLCAGFYPNVAEIIKVPKSSKRGHKSVSMLIKDKSQVTAHPKSVNARQTYFESVWMVFHYKLKTKKVYIHDSTMVSPYPLLFFGGDIQILKVDGQELVSVDDWIKFKASASVAQLVKDLKLQLDKLLNTKITRPGPTVWDETKPEGALMLAIVDLIAGEEKGYARLGSKLGGSIGTKL